MLTTPITLDFAGDTITLNRVNQDNYSSVYFGKNNGDIFNLEVAHTIPAKKDSGGESHLVKLTIEHYSSEGEYLRTSAAWTVIKTFNGVQDDASSVATSTALSNFLGGVGILDAIVGRQS